MGHDLQQVFEASWRRLVGQLYAVCGDLTEAWLRVTAVNVARTRHRRRRGSARSVVSTTRARGQ